MDASFRYAVTEARRKKLAKQAREGTFRVAPMPRAMGLDLVFVFAAISDSLKKN